MLKEMYASQTEKVHKVNYLKYVNVCLCVLVAYSTADSSGFANALMNEWTMNERTFLFQLEDNGALHLY